MSYLKTSLISVTPPKKERSPPPSITDHRNSPRPPLDFQSGRRLESRIIHRGVRLENPISWLLQGKKNIWERFKVWVFGCAFVSFLFGWNSTNPPKKNIDLVFYCCFGGRGWAFFWNFRKIDKFFFFKGSFCVHVSKNYPSTKNTKGGSNVNQIPSSKLT